jgi:hypothetical protein
MLTPSTVSFLLPLLSMMSISPLEGQAPYASRSGNIQMAGQIQSPCMKLYIVYMTNADPVI